MKKINFSIKGIVAAAALVAVVGCSSAPKAKIFSNDTYIKMGSPAELVIEEGYTAIAPNAFENCDDLLSVSIPATVTTLGSKAFYSCDGITSIVIPQGVTTIPDNCFYGCDGLTSVRIPSSVNTIEYNAFHGCESLMEIAIPSSVTTIGEDIFSNCEDGIQILVPACSPLFEQFKAEYGDWIVTAK